MEIEIKGKKINCKNPKGRHTKKGLKLLIQTETEGLKSLDKYFDYLDQVTSECTGLSIEQLDDLESDDKEKLIGFYNGKVRDKIDFFKSSLRLENSEQKIKQE